MGNIFTSPNLSHEEKEMIENDRIERRKAMQEAEGRIARGEKLPMTLSERRIDEDFSPCFQTEDDEG